jgi:hypothetical protein
MWKGGGESIRPSYSIPGIAYWSATFAQCIFCPVYRNSSYHCLGSVTFWYGSGSCYFRQTSFFKEKSHKEVTIQEDWKLFFTIFAWHDRRIRSRIRTRTFYVSGAGRPKNIRIRISTLLLMFAVETFIHRRGFKTNIDAYPFMWIRTRLAPNLVDPIQRLQVLDPDF